MNAAVCGVALGVVSALSQVGGGSRAPFAIYTQFEPPNAVLDSLKQELKSIMSPAGLRFEWRSLPAARESESFAGLAVVTFKGTCDLSGLKPEYIETGALGWTHLMDGQILPYSEVDCNRIRAFLSEALIQLRPPAREQAFGRAVARVLAHELYHIFTQTRHHASSGLAEAAYTVEELMADDFWFAEGDQRVLTDLLAVRRPRDSGGGQLAGQFLFARSGCVRCHGSRGEGTGRGPSLRAAGPSLEVDQLSARLVGKASKMYRRARDRRILWPLLAKPDIENLVTYLSSSD